MLDNSSLSLHSHVAQSEMVKDGTGRYGSDNNEIIEAQRLN